MKNAPYVNKQKTPQKMYYSVKDRQVITSKTVIVRKIGNKQHRYIERTERTERASRKKDKDERELCITSLTIQRRKEKKKKKQEGVSCCLHNPMICAGEIILK